MNSKVYVTQENQRLTFIDAERFGDIIFLTDLEFSKHRASITNDKIIAEIKSKMVKFNPEKDYLILSGDPVIMAFAFHLAFSKSSFGIKILKWDKIQCQYNEIHFKG